MNAARESTAAIIEKSPSTKPPIYLRSLPQNSQNFPLGELIPLTYPGSVVSDEHAKFAYKCLFGCPRLIATTDPISYSQHYRAHAKTEKKRPRRIEVPFWNEGLASVLETEIAPQILRILLLYRAEEPMVTVLRLKYEGSSNAPVVLLIFVREATLSREAGAYAAQQCLDVLEKVELCRRLREALGILVEICEGELEDHSSLPDLCLRSDPRRDIPGLSCATLTGSPILAGRAHNTSYVTAGPLVTDLVTHDVGMISVQHNLCYDDLPYRVYNPRQISEEPPAVGIVKTASQLYKSEELVKEVVSCKQEIELQIEARNLAEQSLEKYLIVPKTAEEGLHVLTSADLPQLEKVDFLIGQNCLLNELYSNLKRYEFLLNGKTSTVTTFPHIGYVSFAPGIGCESFYRDSFHHDFCLTQIIATQDTERLLKGAKFIDLGQDYNAHEIFKRYRHKGLRLSQLPRERLLNQTGTYWTENDFLSMDAQSLSDTTHHKTFFFKVAAKSGFSILKMLRYPIFRSLGFNGEISKSMFFVSLDEKDVSQRGDSGAGVYDLQGRSVCLIHGGMKKSQLIVAQPMYSIMGIINKEKPNVRLFGSHSQILNDYTLRYPGGNT